MTSKIEISHRSVIFTVILLAGIWLLLAIRDILYLLFVAFIVMSALRPMVEYLEKRHIPKILSIICIYILVIGLIALTVSSLVPALVSQISRFVSDFPKYVEIIRPYYQIDIRTLTQQIAPISENIIRITVGLFSNILTLTTVLVITFYMLLEHENIQKFLSNLMPKEQVTKITSILDNIEFSMGAWLRGELVLMLFIGLLAFIGLTFLRVDYALPLALIAGFTEIIPVMGPIISAVPAVFIALTVSPILALATAALYFLIHQLENNLVVPVVMKRAINLSPFLTILSLMIGSQLAGIAGAVLSIPIVLMIRAIVLGVVAKTTSVKSL
jgi:predicted PurR-regulated permease PerM